MIKEYVVLFESSSKHQGNIPDTLDALEKQVAAAIAKGWQPFGSMSVDANLDYFRAYQPVVR